MRRNLKAAVLLVCGLVVVTGGWLGYRSFSSFSASLSALSGIKFSDGRAEVRYRLGRPDSVLGSNNPQSAAAAKKLALPDGWEVLEPVTPSTAIDEYNQWNFGHPLSVSVEFSGSGRVDTVSCYPEAPTDKCIAPGGIRIGDKEETVERKLGQPATSQISDHGSRTMSYNSLGIEIVLVRETVTSIRLHNVNPSLVARLRHWAGLN